MVKKLFNMRIMTLWCLIWVLLIIAIFYGIYILDNIWMFIMFPFTFILPAIGASRQWDYDFRNGTFTKKKEMLKELKFL